MDVKGERGGGEGHKPLFLDTVSLRPKQKAMVGRYALTHLSSREESGHVDDRSNIPLWKKLRLVHPFHTSICPWNACVGTLPSRTVDADNNSKTKTTSLC